MKSVAPHREPQARARRQRLVIWQHRVRQVAVAEMALQRLQQAGADQSTIAAATAALNEARRMAGLESINAAAA